MTDDPGLFPEPAPTPSPSPPPSATVRRSVRQAQALQAGWHPLGFLAPLGRLRVHPDAAPVDDRDAEGLRCGGCAYRVLVYAGDRKVPKCDLRRSHSEASDVRAWWPACVHHESAAP